jgi:hypothetical protein
VALNILSEKLDDYFFTILIVQFADVPLLQRRRLVEQPPGPMSMVSKVFALTIFCSASKSVVFSFFQDKIFFAIVHWAMVFFSLFKYVHLCVVIFVSLASACIVVA